MKEYTIKTRYIFTGEFYIKASSQEEAEKIVLEQCGMNSGEIMTSLNRKTVDWTFQMTPDSEMIQDKNLWEEDPEYPMGDWRQEVNNQDTLLSYSDWVQHQKESDEI